MKLRRHHLGHHLGHRLGHRLVGTLAVFGAVALCNPAFGFSSGAPEGFTASPASMGASCVLCHASFALNSGPGSVSILDLPALYVPDETYSLRVRVEDPARVGAGFELSVEDPTGVFTGDLAVTDAVNTRSAGGAIVNYITHTSSGKANAIADWAALGNAAEFTIQWTAPPADAGEIGFYAAGAAINNGTSNSNDDVYTTTELRQAAGPGDLNGDGAIDTADLGALISAFGTADPVADINNDDIVDIADLGILIGAFGP